MPYLPIRRTAGLPHWRCGCHLSKLNTPDPNHRPGGGGEGGFGPVYTRFKNASWAIRSQVKRQDITVSLLPLSRAHQDTLAFTLQKIYGQMHPLSSRDRIAMCP